MTKRELAASYFTSGYHCAQAVAMAFADEMGMSKETAAKLVCSFGGGMGRLREVCGAVSAMLFVLGAVYGYDTPETGEKKAEHYARVQDVALAFEREHGSYLCRDLLGLGEKRQDPTPTPRTESFYSTRPCPGLIGDAAEQLERYLASHPAVEK